VVAMCNYLCLLVITINFTQVGYSFNEGKGYGTAQVELMLSNPSSFEIIVHLLAKDDTATSVNNSECMAADSDNDYLRGLYIGVFPADLTLTYVYIPICNDYVLEIDETFSISIVSSLHPDAVKNGSPDHVNITIVDNDGKGCINLHTCQFLPAISYRRHHCGL